MGYQTASGTILLKVPPADVLMFLKDGSNIPKWAVGFADDVRHVAGHRWLARKGDREFSIDILSLNNSGLVQYIRDMPDGSRGGASVQLLDAPDNGSVLVMTIPISPTSSARESVQIVDDELRQLSLLLEDGAIAR